MNAIYCYTPVARSTSPCGVQWRWIWSTELLLLGRRKTVPVAAVAATGLGIGAAVLVGVMFMLVPVVSLATAWHPLVRIKLQLHRLAAAKLLQLQRSLRKEAAQALRKEDYESIPE